jgi:ABC-type multidrug transport system permease subunit
MAFFVVGLVPWLFDLPHAGSPLTLAVLMVAYLAATVAFALACAPLFRDAEGGLVYIAFFSVGYLFLSGVSYPLELMPAAWRFVRIFLPVCPATLAYVEVQAAGAPFGDISSQILWLFLQAKVYISVAVIGHYRLLRSASDYEFLKNAA